MGRKSRQTDAGRVRRPDKAHPDPGHLPRHCSVELCPDHYVSSSLISSSPSVSLWSPKSHSLSLHQGDYSPYSSQQDQRTKLRDHYPGQGDPICGSGESGWCCPPYWVAGFQPQPDLHRAMLLLVEQRNYRLWPCREAALENPINVREVVMDLQV